MRTTKQSRRYGRAFLLCQCVLGVSLLVSALPTGATDADSGMTPEQIFEGGTNLYSNWIELSADGLITKGNSSQAEQQQHLQRGAFGGIEDLHLQEAIDKKTTVTLDGRSIFDQHDYKISLGVTREDTGFARFSFENFRNWDDPSGGFFPPGNLHYSLGNALTLDRGKISFEAGWTPKDGPKVTFKYTHTYREGEQSSTIWGAVPPFGTPAIYPSFYSIDEKSDSFQLDVTHHIKSTDFGVGVSYEMGKVNDLLNTVSQFGGGPAAQQNVTDSQGTSYDMVSVHAFTETWLKNNLSFSTGFMFANVNNTFSGSRIYIPNLPYTPPGYFNLNGGSEQKECVVNLNLMATPFSHFTIVPSIRVQSEDLNSNSGGIGTLLDTATGPIAATSARDELAVRERVDLRYTGITNWVFYAGPEWTEGSGNLTENGEFQVNGIDVTPLVRLQTDDRTFFQKYSVGARWYPTRRITLDFGGYYKDDKYNYTLNVDSTPNIASSMNCYPGYLVLQSLQTLDGNVRLTLRPAQNLTLVTRYEYQQSTVHTSPDPVSGLNEIESSTMTSQIIAETLSWTPWSRLSLQLGFNYVLSDTKTPALDYTQAVLDAQNNYWTLNFNSTFVVDNKTDLNLGYFYYESDNLQLNSAEGLPLGAAARESCVTAMLTRRLTPHLRLNLKYGYSHLNDLASGGYNNCDAQVVSSSLQYRF